jgi:formylglycine-generating enzyme required for sulfatase activity
MHSVHQVLFCQNTDSTEAEWEHAAAADVGQREYNIYKAEEISLVR